MDQINSEKTPYRITTDSGCDLSLALCRERDVLPYKMPFTLGGTVITDEMTEESFHEFYAALRSGGVARTSQINPNNFMEFWQPLAESGTPVLHVSLGSAISGSCANAVTAAELLAAEYPGWVCRVVDSANASAGFGLLVLKACELRDHGFTLEENAAALRTMVYNVNSIFTTSDLTALYRGGRVSRGAAAFGTVLNIIPIMHLDRPGHLEVWQKVRGEKKCKERIIEAISELAIAPESQTLIISEADNMPKAVEYGEALKARVGFRDVFYTHIGPTIGAHTGPGLISIFFVGKERT